MAESELPREVRELVGTALRGMEEIELVLLLESEPAGLTLGEIRERLRLPRTGAPLPSLDRLVGQGYVAREEQSDTPRYRFAVTDAATRRAIALLRLAYNERPVTLVRLVYHRPTAAQNFADAFRFTKGEES